MDKIWLIIKREYLTRVRNKTFLLSTFLTPLLLVGLMATVIIITVKGVRNEKVAVADKDNVLKGYLDDSKSIHFEFLPDADTSLLQKGYTGVMLAPGNGANRTNSFQIYTRKNLNVSSEKAIESKLNDAVEMRLMTTMSSLTRQQVDSIRESANTVVIDNKVLSENEGVKQGNANVAFGVGYGAGFLIYITLFLYGAMVMRGVMEEKTNRIAEVMVSSVKPIQLMMGKIIGIGAVGVTQFLLWIILMFSLSSLLGAIVPAEMMQQVSEAQAGGNMAMQGQSSDAVMKIAQAKQTLSGVNWPLIVGCFLFYFIFGYLFYAALFAAVGSAVNEDPQDAQSLMFPITLPIILGVIIMINAINQPDSSLAKWASLIPFFSPIVMMARLPFGVPGTVPYWELGASMLLLIAGFIFVTWLSAKIYRTGILMYGKKPTLKEMWKWAFRKQ